MRVAYVHDWLVTFRGGEKVLAALLNLYKSAPIYTLFYDPPSQPEVINNREIIVPRWLNKLKKVRKGLLPILPKAIQSLDLQSYDLIISTSSCVAKGVLKGKNAVHVCYLHSPMRYIWDQQEEYLKAVRHIPFAPQTIRLLTPKLREWDVQSAQAVDKFVVNSKFVGERARRYYNRSSDVVHPPIELNRFSLPQTKAVDEEPYFLIAGALVAYKRVDLAIRACEKIGAKLIVAGQGPMRKQLSEIAGENTFFVDNPSDSQMTHLLQNANALIFPGVEDFGMIAIEAMACGTPVVAFQAGGALDFIKEGSTGVFFEAQTQESLAECLRNFQTENFNPVHLNKFAQSFSQRSFLDQMAAIIGECIAGER